MKFFRLAVCGMIGLLSLSSCSVKESRYDCPCLIGLDFSGVDREIAGTARLMITAEGETVWADTMDMADLPAGYSAYVPRKWLHVRMWSGTDGLESEGGLHIPLGKDCPKVYMHDSDIRADGEECHERIMMRKNHCVMTVTVMGTSEFPFGMILKGNVSGYDASGNPLPGDFEYRLHDEDIESGYQAVIPRQADSSLMLEIDEGTGEYNSFAIGQYIVSSGYDWSAPDLEDVTVTIDYALTEIHLSIKGWESVYTYDMIL